MKSEILEILRMQEEGKLTREQAAELLSALADQAREKGGAPGNGGGTQGTPSEGAPGPQGEGPGGGGEKKSCGSAGARGSAATATAAIHDIVDAAIGMGVTVGRAATVWGGEVVNMVHRDDGANSITLSSVTPPTGANFSFRNNTVNVSKVGPLTLNMAEFCGNSFNASKVANITVTGGRFSQCNISGSSLNHVTIEGPSATDGTESPAVGIRGCTVNASKLVRVRLLGESALEGCIFQASAVKELELRDHTLIKDSRVNDSVIASAAFERVRGSTVIFNRSTVNALLVRDIVLDRVTLGAARVMDFKLTGGAWTNVCFVRESTSVLQESTFDNCTLADCTFIGCTFRRTTLRNLKLTGISVRNVDFTGLTLETDEAFRRAAGI